MTAYKKMKIVPCLLAAVAVLSGCAVAPTRAPFDTSKLQWPLPPDEARVKYVREWVGDTDLERSFMESLAGGGELFLFNPRGGIADREESIYVAKMDLRGGIPFCH